jgi:hypothetical protein
LTTTPTTLIVRSFSLTVDPTRVAGCRPCKIHTSVTWTPVTVAGIADVTLSKQVAVQDVTVDYGSNTKQITYNLGTAPMYYNPSTSNVTVLLQFS